MNTTRCPRSLRSSLGLLCAMGSFFGLTAVAAADEPDLVNVRVCDASACYRAWNVVDSDKDGYADADELAAGTDPFDAASVPPLEVVLELIGVEQLPTFEFGVGELIVMPTEFQEMRELVEADPFAAFPLGDRKDALSRAGIDADLLTGHGLDPERDGFTLTLGNETQSDGPPRRIGGIDVRLIGVEAADGGTPEEPTDITPEDVPPPMNEPDGSKTYLLPDGGDVTIKPDGGTSQNNKYAPKTEVKYVNPESDLGGEPTQEAFEAWERIRNAVVRTVAGWSKEIGSPDEILDKGGTIILIDPDYVGLTGQISGPPRVTTAQPETKPDLFNPLVPGGGCWPKC